MSERLRLALLDDEIERVAGLSGNAQRMAAIDLVARVEAGMGRDIAGVRAIAVHGRDMTLRLVRDAAGELQVTSIWEAKDSGRCG